VFKRFPIEVVVISLHLAKRPMIPAQLGNDRFDRVR
jgi:hypothetical protein